MAETITLKHEGQIVDQGTPSAIAAEKQDEAQEELEEMRTDVQKFQQQSQNWDFDEICDYLSDLKADYPKLDITELVDEVSQNWTDTPILTENVKNFAALLDDEIKSNFGGDDEWADDDEIIDTFAPYDEDEDENTDFARGKRKSKRAKRKAKRKARKAKRKAKLRKIKNKIKKAAKKATSAVKKVANKVQNSAINALLLPLAPFRSTMIKKLNNRGVSVSKKTNTLSLATKFYNNVVKGSNYDGDDSIDIDEMALYENDAYHNSFDQLREKYGDNFEDENHAVGAAIGVVTTIVSKLVKYFKQKKSEQASGTSRSDADNEEAEDVAIVTEGSKLGVAQTIIDKAVESGKTVTQFLTEVQEGAAQTGQTLLNAEQAAKVKSTTVGDVQKTGGAVISRKYIMIGLAIAILIAGYFLIKKK